jgi:prepilin-type N-terminal cleavage/methylation domain-containing protein
MRKAERGMTLVELLISLAILVIGLGAIMLLITTAIAANNGSKLDTSGTMLAQMVAEQIGSVPASSGAAVTVTDCTGLVLPVATAGGAGPNGAGAQMIPAGQPGLSGNIDWNGQAFGAVQANYRMLYTACGTAGQTRQLYEIRWNIVNLFTLPGPPAQVATKMVTVSARRREQPLAGSRAAGLNRIAFGVPVTIRTIVGQ